MSLSKKDRFCCTEIEQIQYMTLRNFRTVFKIQGLILMKSLFIDHILSTLMLYRLTSILP